jgi:hypothetical protein
MDLVEINEGCKFAHLPLVEDVQICNLLWYITKTVSIPYSILFHHKTCIGLLLAPIGRLGGQNEKAPKILAVEEKMRKTMGLRASRGKKKESDLIRACDLIKQAFEAWSGTTVEKTIKRPMIKGKRHIIYSFNTIPIVDFLWINLKM